MEEYKNLLSLVRKGDSEAAECYLSSHDVDLNQGGGRQHSINGRRHTEKQTWPFEYGQAVAREGRHCEFLGLPQVRGASRCRGSEVTHGTLC